MGHSAPVPPDDGDAPEGDDLDEAEMTSIMDAEQRRELQRAARSAKEPERETARPPPEAAGAVAAEVAIPKAGGVPAEALPTPLPEPAPALAPVVVNAPAPATTPVSSASWVVVAFVLLAAAIAFELR